MGRVVSVSSSQQRSAKWALRIFALVMLCVLVGTWFLVRRAAPDAGQELVVLDRAGPLVVRDDAFVRGMSGAVPADARSALEAFCVNGPYWASDVTVDLDVVVVTSERFYRVAELVASGTYDSTMVDAVESSLLEGDEFFDDLASVDRETIDRFGEDRVRSYLAAARQRAADDALENFVVYAVSSTTTRQHVYVIDLQRVDREAVRRFVSNPSLGASYDVVIAGGQTVVVDPDACVEAMASN